MNIHTKYFGVIDVNEEDFLHFEQGLPGFENYHSFVFLPVDEDGIYLALQSVDEAAVALIVTNPYLFYKDYAFDLDKKSLSDVEINKLEEVAVYSVITLKEPFANSTLNLQAPIVVNVEKKLGKQVILHDTDYQTKHPLLQAQGGEVNARP
ncbi:flagellar assembly factor FliW [Halobacillus andaensis]|uniref:Flagellar assembly factor FliW n=1 Tax=Halobacillus andaensis TaxID=1176239 RepID=A0A917EYM6_HALAA|nr:flagellar assembly protein FliW [Halobacillus andaensis]MBP2005414.1 flagellar assembly factor FliW [Halobacillus andaensis]GGF31290.1 flagellar assembly factor FliW [Halobacillus andaensis]